MIETKTNTTTKAAPTATDPATTTVSTPTADQPKKSKTGCIIAGVLGCLGLLIAGIIITVLVIGYVYYRQVDDSTNSVHYPTINTTNVESNSTHDEIDNDINTPDYTNTNSTVYDNSTTAGNGEVIAADGTSLGFKADPISPDLYAYQVGAYSSQHFSDTDWPALRLTLDYPQVEPMTDANDVGSLWVGAILDNNYFIQIGMMSSTATAADGHMAWNYFWQMWDDQDHYLYGLEEPMSTYDWDQNATNTFTMTCQDPATGTWEFWVNDEVVGKTSTGQCDFDVYNGHVFWELTTSKTNQADLPTFGPFTLGKFQYWDGYDWKPVQSATTSYGYGRIIDGTTNDVGGVCPPYGIQAGPDKRSFQAGSTLTCLENGAVLWE